MQDFKKFKLPEMKATMYKIKNKNTLAGINGRLDSRYCARKDKCTLIS